MTLKSGTQIALTSGDQRATIATVGAAVREYSVDGRDVFVPFPADSVAPAFNGMVLAPWPNRMRDGQYRFRGADYQVALSEPGRGTALHGLVAWEEWHVDAETSDTAVLSLSLPAQPGYPFALRMTVEYRLTAVGLAVSATASNEGDSALPYGIGFHPWIATGGSAVDDCSLRLDAATHVKVDDRLLPTGTAPVDAATDFREPRSLRGVDLDDAWVDPVFDADGVTFAHLTSGDGATVVIGADAATKAWQVCTGDHVAGPGFPRQSVAIEPMSCIADAFRTGDDLVELEPGETHTLTWGARLIR